MTAFVDKHLIARVDLDWHVRDGKSTHPPRFRAALETIAWCKERGATTITLCGHYGRPDGLDPALSLRQHAQLFEEALGEPIRFVADAVSARRAEDLQEASPGSVFMLENIRYYKEEKAPNAQFAKTLLQPYDAHVVDAFASSHRAHTSIVGSEVIAPRFLGPHSIVEVDMLSRAKEQIAHPAVAIIGGAKIATKLPVISLFGELYEHVLVGGRVAVEAEEVQQTFHKNVILPVDYAAHQYDIGPATIDAFATVIAAAEMIVWNGPLGKYEEVPFDRGTKEIVRAIAGNPEAFSIVGGGESVDAVLTLGAEDAFDLVSVGGGAMLDFLAGEPMPGIDGVARVD